MYVWLKIVMCFIAVKGTVPYKFQWFAVIRIVIRNWWCFKKQSALMLDREIQSFGLVFWTLGWNTFETTALQKSCEMWFQLLFQKVKHRNYRPQLGVFLEGFWNLTSLMITYLLILVLWTPNLSYDNSDI